MEIRLDVILKIYKVYIEVGVDIIEINIFGVMNIVLSDYDLFYLDEELNEKVVFLVK